MPMFASHAPTLPGIEAGGVRRKKSLPIALSFLLFAAIVALIPAVPGGDLVALNVLMIGAFVAYVRFRSQRGPQDFFEIILPVGVLYFLYFGASALYIRLSKDHLIDIALRRYLAPALGLAVAAFLALLAGYALLGARTRPSTFSRLTHVNPLVPIATGWVGAFGLSAQKWQSESIWGGGGISPALSTLQQLQSFYFFGWFLAWYEFWAGRLRGLAAVAVLGSLTAATAMVAYFTLGWKSLIIAILALPGMAFYEVRRRLPIRGLLVVLLIAIFAVFPFFNAYRNEAKTLSPEARIDATVNTTLGWTKDAYMDASVFAFFKRLTVVTSLAAIIADTGTVVPYKHGETLILAPIALFIPRLIWPDKPDINVGGEFGRTFRLVAALDTDTMVAPSFPGDLYWNFGIPCVIVGMFLIGGGYRWYYEKFGRGEGYQPVRKAFYGMLFLNALQFEGSVAIVVAGFIKLAILGFLFVVLARHFGLVAEERV